MQTLSHRSEAELLYKVHFLAVEALIYPWPDVLLEPFLAPDLRYTLSHYLLTRKSDRRAIGVVHQLVHVAVVYQRDEVA